MKIVDDETGNSEKDWEIFDVLCRNMDKVCYKHLDYIKIMI